MKRRNFIQSIGIIPIVGLSSTLLGKDIVQNKYDPFIKVYTHKNSSVIYENFKFYQSDNNIHAIEFKDKIFPWHIKSSITIPIDFKVNQKSKDEFINELNKHKVEWKIFELIADNGKSNIYAQMVDGKNKEKAWGV